MSALEIILHDEVQFLDFGESRSAGPWIKLRLKDPDQLHTFRSLNPKECPVFNLTLSAGPILADEQHQSPDVKQAEQDQSVDAKAPYGEQARTLRLSSFFRTPAVWEAIGTDKEFREWIQKQPSCLDGNQDWVTEIGEGRCEAAHVRRAADVGKGEKHPYGCVPLTHAQHQMQHGKEGELGVLKAFRPGEQIQTVEHAKAWFDGQRIKYVQAWGWQKLKADLNFEHWNLIPPSVLQEWAGSKGLGHLLPSGYIE